MPDQVLQVAGSRFDRIRCGIGYVLGLLLFFFIVLLDIPESFVELAKTRLGTETVSPEVLQLAESTKITVALAALMVVFLTEITSNTAVTTIDGSCRHNDCNRNGQRPWITGRGHCGYRISRFHAAGGYAPKRVGVWNGSHQHPPDGEGRVRARPGRMDIHSRCSISIG